MLEVRHLNAVYGQHPAVQDASLSVAKGEIVVILGANGAGKSTLLRSIAGICEGEVSGDISLAGKSLMGLSSDAIVESGIALVPEGRGIFGDLTVKENLMLGAYSARARATESENLAQVLTLFPKLKERQSQIARTMSGGEQQMVAIGRAMMSAPEVLMLDEPSLGLAPLLCKELFQNLRRVKQMGIGILLVEQNARQSLAIADRGYLLENTRITHEDSAHRLATDPAVQKAYLGGDLSPSMPGKMAPESVENDTPVPLSSVFNYSVGEVRRSADQQIGSSIDELVAKATQTSANVQQTNVPSVASDDNFIRSQLAGVTAIQVNPYVSSSEVKQISRDIEAAAQNARKRASSRYINKQSTRHRPNRHLANKSQLTTDIVDTDEYAVPVVEIYKRPRVEVYRRRPGGEFERD